MLPHSRVGVMKKAKKDNWISRKRSGKGGGVEYALHGLPEDVQTEIQIKLAKAEAKKQKKTAKKSIADDDVLSKVIWSKWDKSSSKQKAKATKRAGCCFAVADLVNSGMEVVKAIKTSAKDEGVSHKSLMRWYYKARKFDRSNWTAVLLDERKAKKSNRADFTDEAWEVFKAYYLRLERPTFAVSYDYLKDMAREHGWKVPSESTVKRRIEKEIPHTQFIYLRYGEHKLSELYPSQIRSVEDIEAMEWVNGDGYQHNVFVRWHDGEILRPKTWFWQDVRTRKILAYRTDKSENSDTIRLALMDLISIYGIPRKVTIDNTRAAANKWMTGGVKNRYRFKVKDDDPKGIIPVLGIELHWTSVQYGKGHGQGKPIERAFSHGGIGEYVDKHALLAGHWTGNNSMDKPDNYHGGKDGASYEDFITALDKGVAMWNAREGRDTEMCMGKLSYDQAFERDYAKATVRRATAEQMRLLMLMSEAVTLYEDGTFWSGAGGGSRHNRNRYEAVDLIGGKKRKVMIKFDPQKLHETVYVYDLDGHFLAEAVCTVKAGFGDKSKAREQARDKKIFTKSHKAAAKAQKRMTERELAERMPIADDKPFEALPNITELVVAQGNTLTKHVTEVDELEDLDDFSSDFMAGLGKIKQEQGDK